MANAVFMPITSVPLSKAVLCCDCEVISNSQQDARCVVCGSDSVIYVERIVGSLARAVAEYEKEAPRA